MAKVDTGADRSLRTGKRIPYLMVIPGMLFLVIFFIVPLISLFKISLSTKPDRLKPVYNFTWKWSNFSDAFTQFGGHLVRSFAFAGIATLLCILIAYPLAYFIAFRAGRWKNVLIGLVMVPFFTSFLLRTIAWKTILADQGSVMGFMRSTHLIKVLDWLSITNNGALLNTPTAVIGGLTYNFLPFMLLPIYVSLEKIDRRLFDAAADLYSPFGATFRKVIMPLSLPGVFAGTLLTFIPATGDFINAHFLGDPKSQKVIGTAVQSQFLNQNNYPAAAGISFVLMAIITTMVLIYAKFMGTEDLA
jgi:spermidine/putrescine transport system permease protein